MNFINRNHCVISNSQDLEFLYCFKEFPIFMGCVSHSQEDDILADMQWWISRFTGSIQLNPLIPLDVLYWQSHGAGSVGGLWLRHHGELAEFIFSYSPRSVLEIGGGHGILAHSYLKLLSEARWTIVEPNPTVKSHPHIRIIKGLITDDFSSDNQFDAIVHSHVLEHVYEPNDFIALMARIQRIGGKHIFSVPNLSVMLERKYTNCINFEHTVFLTEPFIDYLLRRHGFDIIEKRYFLDDHSIFYATYYDKTPCQRPIPQEYEHNRKCYEDYILYHEQMIQELNMRISIHEGDIYVFGAHVFTQYLIAFGLDTTRIVGILDNDPVKQGKRLYGTNLDVKSPRVLTYATNPAVILRAGVYNNEIKDDIINNINPNVSFLE